MPDNSTPLSVIDLQFLGRPGAIATGVVTTPAGVLLVDPGPATCLPRLERVLQDAGVAGTDLYGLLLTHVHLDHAGAAGTLVRRYPQLEVFVHERGAPHLVDPSRLLESARRLYGDRMDQLWGEVAPVPEGSIRVPRDGEVLEIGGTRIDVAVTRGHANHHLCYRDQTTGIAYVGDTGGIRVGTSAYVLPPTPPPDIDLPQWQLSLSRIRAWDPSGLVVTHFGVYRDASAHLDALSAEIEAWDQLTRDLMTTVTDEAERRTRFVEAVRSRIRACVTPAEIGSYGVSISLDDCWTGVARYWERRQTGPAPRAS